MYNLSLYRHTLPDMFTIKIVRKISPYVINNTSVTDVTFTGNDKF